MSIEKGLKQYPPVDKLIKDYKLSAVIEAGEAGAKVLPQAVEVEKAVLGAMLIDPNCIPDVLEILEEDCFYKEEHRLIFRAIVNLFNAGKPVDLIMLTEELKKSNDYEKVGRATYLTMITNSVATSANVVQHAQIVLEKYILRRLISTVNVLATKAFQEDSDAFELLDLAERLIFEVAASKFKDKVHELYPEIKKVLRKYELINRERLTLTGVPTGFYELDALTGGLQKSDLIIIAGRPSMGKTAFALSIARNAAVDYQIPVAIFSLEMSVEQLVLRLICAEARVNMHLVKTGRISHDDWSKIPTKVGRLIESKIFIDDTPALSVLELRAKARRLKAEHDIGLIIIDYLQLMQGFKAENREREISLISKSLKNLAKELDVPVVALSQLKRAVEERGDKRPMLSDLRESGSLEQDADVVIFVHRPEVYGLPLSDGTPSEGIAEIIVGKQRNGPTDEFKLKFIKEYARFERLDITREYAEPVRHIEPSEEESGPF